jgi:PAS domain-containing protein
MTEKLLSRRLRRNIQTLEERPAAGSVLETRDFKATAQAIFDVCKAAIGATAGHIVLLSEDGTDKEVLLLDSGGLSFKVGAGLRIPGQGLRSDACRDARVVFDNRLSADRQTWDLPPGPIKLTNVLYAPLVIENAVVGLLGLANKPADFSETDAANASVLGGLAALALRQAQTDEELRETGRHLSMALNAIGDAVITTDHRGCVTLMNPVAERLTGRRLAEAQGRPWGRCSLLSTRIPAKPWKIRRPG